MIVITEVERYIDLTALSKMIVICKLKGIPMSAHCQVGRTRAGVRKIRLALPQAFEPSLEPEHPAQDLPAAQRGSSHHAHSLGQGHQTIDRDGIESVVAGSRARRKCRQMAQRDPPDRETQVHRGHRVHMRPHKNRRNDPDRLVLKKYDPVLRKHVDFREEVGMAKKSKIAKNNQRRVVVERYAEQRSALKAIRSPKSSPEERAKAQATLQRYHATPVRYDCAIETLRMDVRAATCGSSGSPSSRARNGAPWGTAWRTQVELVRKSDGSQAFTVEEATPVEVVSERTRCSPAKITHVDYKDINLLRTFISDRGKIRSRRVTGLTPQRQRQVAVAVKNAAKWRCSPSPPHGSHT